ncbi:MAG: glycosyltransferase family 4 protein [Calothrix sp. MO_167.B12]|nr:glycosyltransferase family 4 protein [Calothrix sp. MO_167.B12]
MKILFLDQSGKPGGAELCLLDIAKPYRHTSLVTLFTDGDFKTLLKKSHIPVQILTNQTIKTHKQSNLIQGLTSLTQIIPLITKLIDIARKYDLIYANTQKALVVGALTSLLTHRPLVYHLHDILCTTHFSKTNLHLAITLANRFASLVIANSQASQTAFINAGGNPHLVKVVYNGFNSQKYQIANNIVQQTKQQLDIADKFVIGHFSRLAPWKGQHILIAALAKCPPQITAILVGDALFGEHDYVQQLHQQVVELGLENRVKFLGFRHDIPQLMTTCDVITHTSTSPEPFGRVIVEAMLCGKPVIAAQAGGAVELVEHGKTGFLVTPGNIEEFAQTITQCYYHPENIIAIANHARTIASQKFDINHINQQISQLLHQLKSDNHEF